MNAYLTGDRSLPFVSDWLNERWLHLLLSWGGIGLDILIVPLLLWRRTRVVAFITVVVFHLTNSLFFDIEVFPWFAIAATTLFFAPDWPRRIGLWNDEPASVVEHQAVPQRWYQLTPRQKAGSVVLAIYFVIQIVLPLRHYAYPGNVNWTTEGDLWAWRMLIVDARHQSLFTVKSNATGNECLLDVTNYVDEAQAEKLGFRPDMMAQFGHHVADIYWTRKRERVSVHVYPRVSINGHDWAQIVAPDTDLATVPRFPHNDWILTQDPPPPPVDPPRLLPCEP
jgi:vitamin K-dependent gamma-carboxylase